MNKILKRALVCTLSGMMAFSLGACSSSSSNSSNSSKSESSKSSNTTTSESSKKISDETKIKNSVATVLDALKAYDTKTLKKNVVGFSTTGGLSSTSGFTKSEIKNMFKSLFKHLHYKTLKVNKKNSKTAYATVRVTNANMSPVITNWQTRVSDYALNHRTATRESITKAAIPMLEDEIDSTWKQNDKVTRTLKFKLIKADGRWVFNGMNSNQTDALTGGFIKGIQNL